MSLFAPGRAAPLLEHLNPVQQQAVTSEARALLVIAGAGTGKTRVLTHRIAWLVKERGVDPRQILAATFTNKAAREMVERIVALTSPASRSMTLGTFHRICARLLRDHPQAHDFRDTFVIYDTDEQRSLIKQAMRQVHCDPKLWDPRAIQSRISHYKSRGWTLERYLEETADETPLYLDEQVAKIFPVYQARLRAAGALDFDDMILEGTALLHRLDAQFSRRHQFGYVFVDEFQDINEAQWALIRALAGTPDQGPCAELFAVGDDDQSIYGFRGAHAGFLEEFQRLYRPEVILLEDNYRSTAPILQVANRVLAAKDWGPIKQLRAASGDGPRPKAFVAHSDVEEAMAIGEAIEDLVRYSELRYRDCALLYRQNAHSRVLEEVLTRMGIPHQVIGGQRFYARAEIRDVVAWLRLIHNGHDIAALERAVTAPPRGIGARTLELLGQVMLLQELGLDELAQDPSPLHGLPGRARSAVLSLLDLLSTLKTAAQSLRLSELLDLVLRESGYEHYLEQSKSIENQVRLDNLQELRGAVSDWQDSYPALGLSGWLEEQALVADVDKYNPEADAVTLMTLHAAKGLEFPAVFMPCFEEGSLPHFRAMNEGTLDEEMRLAYVGITRARRQLTLSAAQQRRIQGQTMAQRPSRFLRDLAADLLEAQPHHLRWLTGVREEQSWSGEFADEDSPRGWGSRREEAVDWDPPARRTPERRPAGVRPATAAPAPVMPAQPSAWNQGDRVRHATFGEGTIQQVMPSGRDYFLSIQFPGVGLKMLAESKAPLERVG